MRNRARKFSNGAKGMSDMSGTAATGSGRAMREASEIHLETQLKTAPDKVAHLYARWHELELRQSVFSP